MNDFEKFQAAVQPYLDGWQSIDIRAVCVRAFGKWVSLGTRIILSERGLDEKNQDETLPSFVGFRAFSEIRKIEELEKLLDEFRKGSIPVAGAEILFGKIENGEVKIAPASFSLDTNLRSCDYVPADFDFPSLILRRGTEQVHSLLYGYPEALGKQDLDWKLRSLQVPYDGLYDALASILRVPKLRWDAFFYSAVAELVAPLRLRLGHECKLSNGKVNIHVESIREVRVENVSIGLIELLHNTPVGRQSYKLDEVDWKKEGDRFIGHKEAGIHKGSSVVLCLCFKGNALDAIKLSDPSALLRNPRILAYSYFDEDLSVIERYLYGKGKTPSEDFEIGVNCLLHFCGFNVGPYGRVKGIQEEIDIMAFGSSSPHILAVECTTREVDANEKISKLARRVKELNERIRDFSVVPLIFTALKRQQISKSDIKKAHSEGIGVVAAEEIKRLLEMAGHQETPDTILHYLQGLMPRDLFGREQEPE